MSTPGQSEWIQLRDLISRKDLNHRRAQVVKWHADADRWEVLVEVGPMTERVRVHSRNISRDHILMIDGTLEVRTEWPAWLGASADEVARKLLAERCESSGSFNGRFSIHIAGQAVRELADLGLVISPPSAETWDECVLAEAIRTVLSDRVQIVLSSALWRAPSEQSFRRRNVAILLRAHMKPNVLQLLVRTTSNTKRFAQMQVFAASHPSVTNLACGQGTVFCTPTDAVVFHLDNMIKLPVTMTPMQAARKVAEMVEVGCEGLICPICLDDMTDPEDYPIFMPCPCSAHIHLKCLQKLANETLCPLCRDPLVRPR